LAEARPVPSVLQPPEVAMYRLPFSRPRVLLLLAVAALGWILAATAGQPEPQPAKQPEPDKAAIAKKEKILNTMFKEELAKSKTDPRAARDLAEFLLRE